MAWRRPGDTPLSEPMMVKFSIHICVTRPQWVKISSPTYTIWYIPNFYHYFCNTIWYMQNFYHYFCNFFLLIASKVVCIVIAFAFVDSTSVLIKPAFPRLLTQLRSQVKTISPRWVQNEVLANAAFILESPLDYTLHINGLMQERRNSIANTRELRLSCINPSTYDGYL